MSVLYRLYQNNNDKSPGKGKWYAKAVMTNVIDTKKLADIMQRNCTVKRADIMAVLTELVETMRDQLQDSKRVKLDGLGSFKLALTSKGAATAADWNPNTHITGVRIRFRPSSTDLDDLTSRQFRDKCKLHYWGIASGKDPNGNTAYVNTPQGETDEEEQGDIDNP